MLEFLTKLFLENNMLRLVPRVLHYVLCIFLSIWVAEKIGYPLQIETYDLSIIAKLFTEYFLLLGITMYFLSTEILTMANSIIQMLFSSLISKAIDIEEFSAKNKIAEPIALIWKAIRETKMKPELKPAREHKRLSRLVTKEFENIPYLSQAFLTFGICYELLIRKKFPDAHFFLISLFIWISYGGLHILQALITEFVQAANYAAKQHKTPESSMESTIEKKLHD